MSERGWSSTSPTDLFFNDRDGNLFGIVWLGERGVVGLVLYCEGTTAWQAPSMEAARAWVEAQEEYQRLDALA